MQHQQGTRNINKEQGTSTRNKEHEQRTKNINKEGSSLALERRDTSSAENTMYKVKWRRQSTSTLPVVHSRVYIIITKIAVYSFMCDFFILEHITTQRTKLQSTTTTTNKHNLARSESLKMI